MTISVVGDALIDIIAPVEKLMPGSTYHRDIHLSFGGLANVAVWVARLGERVQFMGKVGNDYFGWQFRRKLNKEGVTDYTLTSKSRPTGICLCLVDARGERTMIASHGANDSLTKNDAKRWLPKLRDSARIYFSGYSFIPPRVGEVIHFLMQELKGHTEIWFNPGSPDLALSTKDIIKTYCDVLILNEEEARRLTQKTVWEEIDTCLAELASLTILTLGARGSRAIEKDKAIEVPAYPVDEVVDTTGAGDAFSAGAIVGREKGLSLEECLSLGNKIAAKVIQKYGAD